MATFLFTVILFIIVVGFVLFGIGYIKGNITGSWREGDGLQSTGLLVATIGVGAFLIVPYILKIFL